MTAPTPQRPAPFRRFSQRLRSLVGRAVPRLRQGALLLLLLLTLLVGTNGPLTAITTLVPPSLPNAAVPSTTLTPMTQDQALVNQANAWGHASAPQMTLAQLLSTGPHTTPTGATIPRQVVTPQPTVTGSVTLSATAATTLTTSDNRFTITVPAGALTSSQLASVGGPVTLQVTKLAGPVGGGASGHLSLGTFRIELLGPKGRLTGLGFQHPLQLGLHYDPAEAGGFINYGVTLQVESDTPQRTQGVVTPGGGSVPAGQPTREVVPTSLSAGTHSISGQSMLSTLALTGSAMATYNTSAPQANWPTVQDFQTDLNSGSLNDSYPLILPPAPGSFVPDLNLSYSSATVNEDHGLQTSAPWVGEGWSLDLGSINWSQIDENSGCQQAAPPRPTIPPVAAITGRIPGPFRPVASAGP
jgi:hypothetical protein